MEQIERKSAEFEDFGRFQIESRSFSRQFSGIYKARLSSLKAKVLKRARAKWSKHKVLHIVDLTKDEYEEVPSIIIGTLYKHQELKPSILKEIAEELQAVPQPSRLNYCSTKDSLYLEDDVSRVKLVGNLTAEALVTGLICAVCGHQTKDGSFWVEDVCYPGPYLRSLNQTPSSCAKDHDKFILFLSGLDFVNEADSIPMDLLIEWITGSLGEEFVQEEAAKIVRVIIAGNSVRGLPKTFTRKGYFENKRKEALVNLEMHHSVHRLDKFISKIAGSCSVTLMPGEFDPSCHSLPQHSLHPNILPISSRGKNLYGTTNPWIGKIGSRIVGGSSGQPIEDIMKVSNVDLSPLDWLEKTLEWQHFAPTAPDTLAEYPFDQADPLVMNEIPNIYFVGNMERYETKLVQSIDRNDDSEGQPVRLICIPKFSTSQTAVLVDLDSLDTKPVSFGAVE
ncbi:DNA polymerase delta small subunit isoform X1 [Nasonia vitripennis]|uniref:DNA polymerase delta small subunit n=1 Tax=Nasonia vitripennis TaxID=7425 RepID=A0A7M7GD19_NASVI|nr:DNA polymerase delta small subunit isoform X1 [Nasonia vitripennis]